MLRTRFFHFLIPSIFLWNMGHLLVGCHSRSSDGASDVSGKGSWITDFLPSLRHKDPALLRTLARDMALRIPKVSSSAVKPRQVLKIELLKVIEAHEGLPGDQLYEILRLMLSNAEDECGGVSCTRVLGMKEEDINPFLDELLTEVEQNTSLKKSEHAKKREILLASLSKNSDDSFDDLYSQFISQKTVDKGPLAGTCPSPVTQRFSPRYMERSSRGRNSPTPLAKTIDYRHDRPKHFQGGTGACHLYSALSMLDHSHHEALKVVQKVDIPRTFLDYWTDNLGDSLERALDDEVKYIRTMTALRKQYVEKSVAQGIPESSAHERWQAKAYINVRMRGHGGYASIDFLRLKQHGAVMLNHDNPRLTIYDLDDIAGDLANLRMKISDRLVQEDTPDQEIKDLLEPVLSRLYAERLINQNLREPLAEELDRFTMKGVIFDRSKMDESIKSFMLALEKNGPLGVSRRKHATTVVGYDAKEKVFYLRDSADRYGSPYTPVSQMAFFEHLDNYYVLHH